MPRIRAASIDEHKALTRQALLDAAYQLIEEAETAEVSLAEVALSAGIGRTTLYDYFSDRDDLIAALVEDELPVVIGEIIEGVDGSLSIGDQLAELAVKTVEFVATDRVYGVILHREVGRMGLEAQERIRQSHSDLSSTMAGLYRRGVEAGIFDPLPPALAGRLIQDIIMSAARVLIDGRADRQAVTASLRSFLLKGLGYDEFTNS
jgi:AcrR family transcriptional regulator